MATSPASEVDGLWPFHARQAELERALAAVSRPTGAIVVLAGESGVGKSRLAREIADRWEGNGRAVLRVSASALLAEVPLGALSGLAVAGPGLATVAHDPAALFAAGRAALAALPGEGPALVVADDMPHLDALSSTLLARLVASGDAVLLVTLRDGEQLPDTVLSLWSADRCTRIDVTPLSVEQIEPLLGASLGAPIAHHAAVELHAASRGNPLYLREVVLGARDAGRLAESGGVWQLTGDPVPTPALRDLVRSRARRLDAAAVDALERLAVCSPLPIEHLPGGAGSVAVLEAAGWASVSEEAGVLVCRLTHPQYTAAIRDTLPRARVAEIVTAQAAALEAAPSAAADALRVARWRISAGLPADPVALATAAALARQGRDHRAVEELTAAALAATGPRADLLMLRGEALGRLGRIAESIDVLDAALATASEDGSPPEATWGIIAALAFAWASVPDGLGAGLAVLDRLDRTDPTVEIIRSTLLLYLEEGSRSLEAAEAAAALLGDSEQERVAVSHARAQPLVAVGRVDEAIAEARRALDFAQRHAAQPGSTPTLTAAAQTLAVVMQQASMPDDAWNAAMLALTSSTTTDDEPSTRIAEFRLGQVALDRGRLGDAERWLKETRSGAMTIGPESLIVPATALLAITHLSRRDADEAERLLGGIPPRPVLDPPQRVARALLAAQRGSLDEARATLVDSAREAAGRGYIALAGQYLQWLARFVDPVSAAAQFDALPPSDVLTLPAAHARADAVGDRRALEAVASAWEQRGALLWAAEAYASAARAAVRDGDPRRAAALRTRVDALLADCGGAITPPLEQPTGEAAGLTAREREIAVLAAGGASSKEIAAQLFLSSRTIDNHLRSIYMKLDVGGRRELAELVRSAAV